MDEKIETLQFRISRVTVADSLWLAPCKSEQAYYWKDEYGLIHDFIGYLVFDGEIVRYVHPGLSMTLRDQFRVISLAFNGYEIGDFVYAITTSNGLRFHVIPVYADERELVNTAVPA